MDGFAEVYENQALIPSSGGKWRDMSKDVDGVPGWSNLGGTSPVSPVDYELASKYTWSGDWTPSRSNPSVNDEQGWQYAPTMRHFCTYGGRPKPDPAWPSTIRRRLWRRGYKKAVPATNTGAQVGISTPATPERTSGRSLLSAAYQHSPAPSDPSSSPYNNSANNEQENGGRSGSTPSRMSSNIDSSSSLTKASPKLVAAASAPVAGTGTGGSRAGGSSTPPPLALQSGGNTSSGGSRIPIRGPREIMTPEVASRDLLAFAKGLRGIQTALLRFTATDTTASDSSFPSSASSSSSSSQASGLPPSALTLVQFQRLDEFIRHTGAGLYALHKAILYNTRANEEVDAATAAMDGGGSSTGRSSTPSKGTAVAATSTTLKWQKLAKESTALCKQFERDRSQYAAWEARMKEQIRRPAIGGVTTRSSKEDDQEDDEGEDGEGEGGRRLHPRHQADGNRRNGQQPSGASSAAEADASWQPPRPRPTKPTREEVATTVKLNQQMREQMQMRQMVQVESSEVDAMARIIEERNREIEAIHASSMEINEIFQDLAALVKHDGEVLARVEENVDAATKHTEKGVEELFKARELHKDSTCSVQ